MPNEAVKTYVKHPNSPIGEAFKIATEYARNALKTLSNDKVLDAELRQKVQEVINEKFSNDESKPFRDLIELHYVQGRKMEEVRKIILDGVSLPQIYDWRSEVELIVADEIFLAKVLAKVYRTELTDILKTDPDMVAAVSETNNLTPASKRGRKPKE